MEMRLLLLWDSEPEKLDMKIYKEISILRVPEKICVFPKHEKIYWDNIV